ncbi:hypothetical protein D9619_007217 [Psilocybe cf. subviscida]|uniref:Uncharacterized protein n=1 Tax=Psilocybe cf. subviscida TaxID=2480587 RepID=A0A8H5EWQ8_9AGAR|nr:hypothetical protein D9619_007217 [Psilocybe cf. subviscida]
MTTSNPAAMLADSMNIFSKAAHKVFSEVEAQTRREVAQAVAEAREAKLDRDRARKELHTLQMSLQSMMQETATNKAALVQAETTIAHQTETLTSQAETITQLRRELSQSKDQSRNWQEHFLRVEQERCTQSFRIEELVAEKLQLANATALLTPKSSHGGSLSERRDPSALYTPKSASRNVVQGSGSAQSKGSKAASTQPPSYESVGPRSPLSLEHASSSVRTPTSQTNGKGRPNAPAKAQKSTSKPRTQSQPQSQSHPQRRPEPATPRHAPEAVAHSSQKRPRKNLLAPQSAKKSEPLPRAVTTKVVRRVEAVLHVKQEDDSDEEDLSLSPNGAQHPAPTPMRDVTRSSGHYDAQRQRGHQQQQRQPQASGSRGRQRASRSRIIHDEEEEQEEGPEGERGVYRSQSEGSGSEDEEEEVYAATTYNPPSSGRLRNLSRINYREDEYDDDEDELTMGAEDNHEEVYGTKPVGVPAKKKRKVAG